MDLLCINYRQVDKNEGDKGAKMRKSFCSLIISGLLLFPGLAVAGEIPPDHSIFSETNWIFERSSEDFSAVDFDGASVVYNKFRLYHHQTQYTYTMQEGVVFGETVTRLYHIIDEYKRVFHYAFRLLGEDGIWRGGYKILWPQILKDSSGKITGARLVMVDENREIMFTRDVMRK